mmetsp:Transcript_8948/g.17426  ORF Transcript_8948/g.17426 Transcript_8948/m.17426 type:complete len:330 (+) Transcript_8948:905-1894(+)
MCLSRFRERMESVLAIGVQEDPFGDIAAEAEFEKEAAEILAIADQEASNNEDNELELVVDKTLVHEVKGELEKVKLAEKKAEAAAAPKEEEKKLTEKDKEEWDKALTRVEAGKTIKSAPAKPVKTVEAKNGSLHCLKCQIVNLLIMSGVSKMMPRATPQVMEGLGQILDFQAKINPRAPNEYVLPILSVLLKRCKTSADARAHMKRFIFGSDATRPTGYTSTKNMEPPPYVNIKTMKDEAGNWDLRSILTKHICSFNMGLKKCISELIFVLCGENSSEYIRLCGFGSAAGLLADKGLPGFEKMSEQAYSLDEMVARQKAAEKAKAKAQK